MKKLLTKIFLVALVCFSCVCLFACEKGPEVDPTPVRTLEEAKTQAQAAFSTLFADFDENAYEEADAATLLQIQAFANTYLTNAVTPEDCDGAVSVITALYNQYLGTFKKYASGVQSFVASSYEERTEILAILEAYAYKHFLTGFSMIDDGGYTLYSTSVKRGVDTYVPGYGWATLSDGEIIADLSGETNPDWKRYYHSFETSDPKQLNYADDKGSVVGDLISYVSSSYWDTRLNETNDGYEWYCLLANAKPQAVNPIEGTTLATKYEWPIKVGGDLKYATLSTNPAIAAFNGRPVEAQDYITPYQAYYTKKLGWARSAENLEGAGSIKGTAAYYNASASGFNAQAWENVGLKVEQRGDDWYMTVEFNTPCTPFYAMYYMNSGMFSPLPYEFITTLGTLNGGDETNLWEKGCNIYGKTSIDLGLSPVDTYLSLGIFTVEAWEADSEIVFKRNPNYTICGEDRYKIAGVHLDILEAANTDVEAGYKEFMAGKLSACGVPSTKPEERTHNDSFAYAVYTPGSGNYKLNVNACDQELWIQLFGEDGSITTTPEEDYWVCEPAMSDSNFLLGLSWAIDRETLAASLGRGACLNYFGDEYLSDPENGVVYNTTAAHNSAMKDLTMDGQYPLGYNLEIAKGYFDEACKSFIASGIYSEGDVIEIEIAWQTESQFENYGDPIIEMWESAFNAVGAAYGLTLDVENWAGAVWSDVYYEKMMVGQFDVGFGSVSGNALNPINFLEVLKSDNSSGFTLNWGADTSEVNLEFKGVLWSFDSLWQAADTGAYFERGQVVSAHNADFFLNEAGDDYDESTYVANEDGSYTFRITTNPLLGVEGLEIDVESVSFDGYNAAEDYVEWSCDFEYDKATGLLVVTVSKEAADVLFGNDNAYLALYGHLFMFDVYYSNTYNRVPSSEVDTIQYVLEWIPTAE